MGRPPAGSTQNRWLCTTWPSRAYCASRLHPRKRSRAAHDSAAGPEPDQRDPLAVQDRDVAQHLPGQPMPDMAWGGFAAGAQ